MGVDMHASTVESNLMGKNKPSILVVGPRGVGKRTLVGKIVSTPDREAMLESDATSQSWTIDTKYYTVDVDIWLARIEEAGQGETAMGQCVDHHEALVMIFDQANVSSFQAVRSWASRMDLTQFEILLCVGNKADKVPNHFGHSAYRRYLLQRGGAMPDPTQSSNFGVQRTDGISLLSGDDSGESGREDDVDPEACRVEYNEWCANNGVEYIECCAVNTGFDRCLSQDGDQQGIVRVVGALFAHMWPGLTMKPRGTAGTDANKCAAEDHLHDDGDPQDNLSSDDESEESVQYERLLEEASDESSQPSDLSYQPIGTKPGENSSSPAEPHSSASGNVPAVVDEAHSPGSSRRDESTWVSDWGEFQEGTSAGSGSAIPPLDGTYGEAGRPADWVASEEPSFVSQAGPAYTPLPGEVQEEEQALSSSAGVDEGERIRGKKQSPITGLESEGADLAATKAAVHALEATVAEANVRISAEANSAAVMNALNAAPPDGAILGFTDSLQPADPGLTPVEEVKSALERSGQAAAAAAEQVAVVEVASSAGDQYMSPSSSITAADGQDIATLEGAEEASALNFGPEDPAAGFGALSEPPESEKQTDVPLSRVVDAALEPSAGSDAEMLLAGSKAEVTAASECSPTQLEVATGDCGPLMLREEDLERAEGRSKVAKEAGQVDDMERLMSEMANMRANLSGIPDATRREMAARMAMKMARLFDADDSDNDL